MRESGKQKSQEKFSRPSSRPLTLSQDASHKRTTDACFSVEGNKMKTKRPLGRGMHYAQAMLDQAEQDNADHHYTHSILGDECFCQAQAQEAR